MIFFNIFIRVMKASIIFFFLLLAVFIPAQDKNDFVLKPCTGNDLLNSNTSESDLIAYFGKNNFKRVERFYSEGTERVIGTVFFSDTPKEFFIKWKDTLNFKNPDWLEIHGDSSIWSLSNGIKIRMPIKELAKLNGRPFSFVGFDWDYGGGVNLKGGKLNSDCYSVKLYYDFENITEPEWKSIIGDKIINSNSDDIKNINIYVDGITVKFK